MQIYIHFHVQILYINQLNTVVDLNGSSISIAGDDSTNGGHSPVNLPT